MLKLKKVSGVAIMPRVPGVMLTPVYSPIVKISVILYFSSLQTLVHTTLLTVKVS